MIDFSRNDHFFIGNVKCSFGNLQRSWLLPSTVIERELFNELFLYQRFLLFIVLLSLIGGLELVVRGFKLQMFESKTTRITRGDRWKGGTYRTLDNSPANSLSKTVLGNSQLHYMSSNERSTFPIKNDHFLKNRSKWSLYGPFLRICFIC